MAFQGAACVKEMAEGHQFAINCPYQFVEPRTIAQRSPLAICLNIKNFNQMCSSPLLLQICLHADLECLVQGLSFRILGLLHVLVGISPNP